MGFDLYLLQGNEFRGWNDEQWKEFFSRGPSPEEQKLGGAGYVGLALEAIVHNLEGGSAGSKYPLVMRIDKEETPGWYADEMGRLREELEDIKSRLSTVPVNRSTLMCDSEEDVTRHVQEFQKRHPGRPVNSI